MTLVELLVVLSILSLLAAIVFPVTAAARRRGHEVQCTANLKQIGSALLLYMQDYELPPNWIYQLHPSYAGSAELFVCPNDPDADEYGWSSAGLWSLFAKETAAGFQRPAFPVSYGDFGFMRDPAQRQALLESPSGSYTVCVLHGIPFASGSLLYRGRTVRLGFDGSVRVVWVDQPLPEFYPWRAFCDDPMPEPPDDH